jgi:drug/metabolite transporter (DMT)-like permease
VTGRAWGLFALASLLFGIPYLLNAVAIESGLGTVEIAFGRCAIGALALLPVALARGALGAASRRWRSIVVFSFLDMAVPFVLISAGQHHLPSSLAAVLVSTVPIFVALLALRLEAAERVARAQALGLAIGFVGVLLIYGVGLPRGPGTVLAATALLLASASYATATLRYPRAFAGVDPIGVVCLALAAGAVSLLPALAVDAPGRAPSPQGAAALLALGVLCSALGGWAYFTLIALAGASRTSVITYVAPAIAVVGAVLLLGERPSAGTLGGLAVVLAGSWLATDGRVPLGRGDRDRGEPPVAGQASPATAPGGRS